MRLARRFSVHHGMAPGNAQRASDPEHSSLFLDN
jgi:hypothetical protein